MLSTLSAVPPSEILAGLACMIAAVLIVTVAVQVYVSGSYSRALSRNPSRFNLPRR